jgi:hypothetical protein
MHGLYSEIPQSFIEMLTALDFTLDFFFLAIYLIDFILDF